MQRVERLYYHYTPAALEDEILYLLSSKNEAKVVFDDDGNQHIHISHPYLDRAEDLLFKINVYDPLLEFIIVPNDIPLGLAQALRHLGDITKNRIISNAVRRIYESVNPEYYHKNGIHCKVKWRFE